MKKCNDCIHLSRRKKTHTYMCSNSKSKRFKVLFPHKKTRKACNLYELKYPGRVYSTPVEDFTPTKDMKLLEDYRDKQLGKEIWVIGSGWSLDEYPDDFFDDKISIILSTAFMAFPRSTYIFSGHDRPTDWIVQNSPESLEKCILAVPLPLYDFDECRPRKYGNAPIWMRVQRGWHMPVPEIIVNCRKMAIAIMEKRSTIYTPCWSGANIAVTAAVVLGADKITMVGCSTVPLKNHSHALRAGITNRFYPGERHLFPQEALEGKTKMQRIWRKGTSLLAELSKPYGIEIRKYYYKRGYEEIEPLSNFDDLVKWPP